MKTIIAGTRSMTELAVVAEAVLASGFPITEVVSGGAPGIDSLGERWAEKNGIPVTRFQADWKRYGRRAGPIRNTEMAGYADAVIAVWDGRSRGTRNIIQLARRKGLRVYVHRLDLENDSLGAREPQLALCAGWA
jgi:predicted Rossmann fold nucleotide-binding protein DprA/Smf involved in DNA uptake